MKKILLATSILAGTAGLAAAEVSLSGSARMGLLQDFGDVDTGFTSRARVVFTLSGESDAGFSFGASFRADNADEASDDGSAGSVFLSSDYGKLSMGDVDGAALSAVGHIDGVGLTGLSDLNESIYLANGGLEDNADGAFGVIAGAVTDDPTALYEYSTGAWAFYMSATQPNFERDINAGLEIDNLNGDAFALGGKYSVDAYTFGLGYENLSVDVDGALNEIDIDHWIGSAAATFGTFTVKATYGFANGDVVDGAGLSRDVDLEQYGLSGTYVADALSITGYLNKKTADRADVQVLDLNAYGLGAAYDLGGGASLVGGVVNADFGDGEGSDTAWDFGVNFSF